MLDVINVSSLARLACLPRQQVKRVVEDAGIKVALVVDGVEYLDGPPAREAIEIFASQQPSTGSPAKRDRSGK